jgi:energy-coupling factor transporter ATP-binding protein EcfA2
MPCERFPGQTEPPGLLSSSCHTGPLASPPSSRILLDAVGDQTAMLDIARLRKEFGATIALDDVSLRIRQGEMVGIIGRSGAGKSTLLRAVNRLVEPTSGSIRHGERDVTALKGQQLAPVAAPLRHDLPAVQPGVPAGRADQRAGRAGQLSADDPLAAEDVHPGGARACRAHARPGRDDPLRPAARRHLVRRSAAARGDRARAGPGAEDHPRRRAHRLARSAQRAPRDGNPAQREPAGRHHRHVQPPYPRYRAGLLRPRHRNERRPRRVRRPSG